MLKLYNCYTYTIKPLYTFFYLYGSELIDFLLFYPVGILVTIYILIAILYMLISASNTLIFYWKLLCYNLDISMLQSLFEYTYWIRKFLPVIFDFVYDLCFFFSKYIFVFYFKRVEFYIFWFFVITWFINL